MRLVITASCRCDSSLGLNGRLHWAVRRRKTNAIRRVIRWAWLGQPVRPSVPCVVTLVRIGPRTMDDDNNAGALKSVRDEVAAMLDARERWYLVNSRFRVEAWVTQDDSFWTDVLEFWRAELGKKLKPSTKPGA